MTSDVLEQMDATGGSPTADTVRLGVLSDLHLAPVDAPDGRWINRQPLSRSNQLLGKAIDRIRSERTDALLLLGDLTEHGRQDELESLSDRVSSYPGDVWAVPGNHDLQTRPDPLALIGVKTPTSAGTDFGPVTLAAGALERGQQSDTYFDAGLAQRRLWDHRKPVVWLSHFPVLDTTGVLAVAELPHAGDLTNRIDVAEALAPHDGPVIALAGHLHVQWADCRSNVLQLVNPALVECPHSYSILSVGVHGDQVDLRWSTYVLEPFNDVSVNTQLGRMHERWQWRSDGRGWRRPE